MTSDVYFSFDDLKNLFTITEVSHGTVVTVYNQSLATNVFLESKNDAAI